MCFFFQNPAVCEIVWKKCVTSRQATDDDIIRRVRIARRITKATNTHSEFVTVNAFPQQQCLRERASMPRYTYIARVAGGIT